MWLTIAYILLNNKQKAMSFGYCLFQIIIALQTNDIKSAMNWGKKTNEIFDFDEFEKVFLNPFAKELLKNKEFFFNQ